VKRGVDVAISAILLVLTLPITAATALLVRLRLGRPVLFRQARAGRGGEIFTIIKFRTMRDGTDKEGRPLPDSARLTGFGRFLRSASLDELPELWNVLVGDMSLVGPRPLLPDYLELYSPEQARRHEVRPGITGWAQVNGRNELTWERRLELDVYYVDNRSLWLDAQILFATIRAVLRREGISHAGHVTMERFRGSAR
jgi:lipopolysaccharide/colanic/teichoic acid biosynthesis glycosyltransferase